MYNNGEVLSCSILRGISFLKALLSLHYLLLMSYLLQVTSLLGFISSENSTNLFPFAVISSSHLDFTK